MGAAVRVVAFVNRAARLTEAEVALLEVLDSRETVVELPASEALEQMAVLFRDHEVRPEPLVHASASEPARVRERLRFILASVGETHLAEKVPPASTPSVTDRALQPLAAVTP